MKKLLPYLLCFHVLCSFGQESFFDQPIEVGSYYYPEQWDEDEWSRDLSRMAELGFTFTHFGEFSWSKMEPQDGEFDFEWLDKAIDIADSKGLKVILCTPSPTPPAWLSTNHPEILVKNEDGVIMRHGSRQHASWSSDVYRGYVNRIVAKLGERYGKDDRIWGWQLDNEPSHYNTFYDYSASAEGAFRTWLEIKYASIQELNERWGNSFWSQTYTDFNQIRIPNAKELVQPPNPHALLDFQEFNNGEMTEFLAEQARELRKYITKGQFITTNYMLALPHIDPFPGKDNLDFASYTNYPINSYGETDTGDLGYRLGSAYGLIMSHEFNQSVNGYTGVMELQPGQVNWGQYNTQPWPGAVRMWIWHTYAMGARFVCNYRFRQPVFGNEQYHQGVIMPDGESVARGGAEYVQAIKELNKFMRDKDYKTSRQHPLANGRTAIIWDRKSVMDCYNFPHTQQWDAMSPYNDLVKTLKSFALPFEFIDYEEALDAEEFPFAIVPAIQLVDEQFVNKLKSYVEAGGHLVITSRTGQKNRDGHLWRAKPQEPILELIGAEVEFYDHLPSDRTQSVTYDGKSYKWTVWSDILKVTGEGVEALATHDSGFYKGKPSVVSRKFGTGSVTYLGTKSEGYELEKGVLQKLYDQEGVKLESLPPYVFKEYRDGNWILVNYSSQNYPLSKVKKEQMIMGQLVVEPAGVAIWLAK